MSAGPTRASTINGRPAGTICMQRAPAAQHHAGTHAGNAGDAPCRGCAQQILVGEVARDRELRRHLRQLLLHLRELVVDLQQLRVAQPPVGNLRLYQRRAAGDDVRLELRRACSSARSVGLRAKPRRYRKR